jgi:hypothetical protein
MPKKKQNWERLIKEIEEAKKDQKWRKELKKFIKTTTG